MCSRTTECVFVLQNVFLYYRMCSLTTECVLRWPAVHSVCLGRCFRIAGCRFDVSTARSSPRHIVPCARSCMRMLIGLSSCVNRALLAFAHRPSAYRSLCRKRTCSIGEIRHIVHVRENMFSSTCSREHRTCSREHRTCSREHRTCSREHVL